MGVDAELFSRMVTVPGNQIVWLRPEEMRAWNLVNNGRLPPKWAIESVAGSLYLRGEQQTSVGLGKAVFICAKRRIVFYPVYDAGDNAQRISDEATLFSVTIDGEFQPLESQGRLMVKNGFVSDFFPLTEGQAQGLKRAHSIGFAAQVRRDAQTFWGFSIEIRSKEDSSKIDGFVNTCLSPK